MSDGADLGPLRSEDTVAVIGGGPGGASCAITLAQESKRRNLNLDIVLFEGKRFGLHYNQCAGVLSPPITSLLQEMLGLTLPEELVQRRIHGYVMYSENNCVRLQHDQESENENEDISLAVRRVEFDRFMMNQVLAHGVRLIDSRVTDVEFLESGVVVYSWSGTCRAKAIVGAFGLARAMCSTLSVRTRYCAPPCLEAIVSKVHPAGMELLPSLLGNDIHVFLPHLSHVEFAALIPKGNHVTIIVAGRNVTTREADRFLQLRQVRDLLQCDPKPEDYFKGTFPVGLARHPFGDRYVTLGDSAGLVRPFKGKGVNSAIITGHLAAKTMLNHGVSREAFQNFWSDCGEFVRDVAYGKLVRRAANVLSRHLSLEPVVSLAKKDAAFREVLYDCVSGRRSYRQIVRRKENLRTAARLLLNMIF